MTWRVKIDLQEYYKEEWAGPQNWLPTYGCFATLGSEETCESSVVSMQFKLVKLEGNHFWLLRRTDAEHEEPIYQPPDVKSKMTGKKLMLRRIECRRRREWQRARWLQSVTDSRVMGLLKLWEIWMAGKYRVLAVHGVPKIKQVWVTEQHQIVLAVLERWFR